MAAIRGAICAQNTCEDISARATELVSEIFRLNNLRADCVEAIIFSATEDLTACYPATAVRERLRLDNVAFFCVREMRVEQSLDHCLRALVLVNGLAQQDVAHCYLGKAARLRPDLTSDAGAK